MSETGTTTKTLRSVWISDVHLGSHGCQAKLLLQFLRAVRCERLYLVGDIIDLWAMRRGVYWPASHNHVLRQLLALGQGGTRVIFVPGNHDEAFRAYPGMSFGGLMIRNQVIHETAAGKRLLVIHGDQFDRMVQFSPVAAMIGSKAYDMLMHLNRPVNFVRRHAGLPYWSLSAFLKDRVKEAAMYISAYEQAVVNEAVKYEVDGVVCGHIHRPALRHINGVFYGNCGDWMESCTAIVEHADGALELLRWCGERFGRGPEADEMPPAARVA